MISAADIRWSGLLLAIALAALAGCVREPAPVELAGGTMGTTWHVTYVPADDTLAPERIQKGIETLLESVNASMSTYREDSEISRFNRAPRGEWFAVTQPFITVLQAAIEVGDLSGGAYDVTVGPLVDLWGFGAAGRNDSLPDEQAVKTAQARTGVHRLRVDAAGGRVFKGADVALDFSSLAKGYGVDVVSGYLLEQGIERHLVEIGGELRGRGASPGNDPWRVAIEKPAPGSREPGLVIPLTDVAVATSGDYRNFFEIDGRRYSHTIDPRTGYPVTHDLVSVTVVHDNTMLADAWATALEVLGYNEGSQVAEKQGLAVYFIRRGAASEEGAFHAAASTAFRPLLEAGQ